MCVVAKNSKILVAFCESNELSSSTPNQKDKRGVWLKIITEGRSADNSANFSFFTANFKMEQKPRFKIAKACEFISITAVIIRDSVQSYTMYGFEFNIFWHIFTGPLCIRHDLPVDGGPSLRNHELYCVLNSLVYIPRHFYMVENLKKQNKMVNKLQRRLYYILLFSCA